MIDGFFNNVLGTLGCCDRVSFTMCGKKGGFGFVEQFYFRAATGKASDRGANKTVNGYMAFLLFSVAGLACEHGLRCFARMDDKTDMVIDCSCPLHRLNHVHDHSDVRRGVIDEQIIYFWQVVKVV